MSGFSTVLIITKSWQENILLLTVHSVFRTASSELLQEVNGFFMDLQGNKYTRLHLAQVAVKRNPELAVLVYAPLCLPVCAQGTLLIWSARAVLSLCLSWPCRSSRALIGFYCRSLDQLRKRKTHRALSVECILGHPVRTCLRARCCLCVSKNLSCSQQEISRFFTTFPRDSIGMLCFTFFGFQEEFQSLEEAEKHDVSQICKRCL